MLPNIYGKRDVRHRRHLPSSSTLQSGLSLKTLAFEDLSQSWLKILSKIPCPNRSLAGQWIGESWVCVYWSTLVNDGLLVKPYPCSPSPGKRLKAGIWRRDRFTKKSSASLSLYRSLHCREESVPTFPSLLCKLAGWFALV